MAKQLAKEPPEETPKGKAKKDHELLQDVAARLFKDNPEKAERFVDKAMDQLGHTRVTSWEDTAEEPPEGSEEEVEEEDDDLLGDDDEEETPRRRGYWKSK